MANRPQEPAIAAAAIAGSAAKTLGSGESAGAKAERVDGSVAQSLLRCHRSCVPRLRKIWT